MKRFLPIMLLSLAAFVASGAENGRLVLDTAAIAEAVPLAMETAQLATRVMARMHKHAEELARRGIVEVAASSVKAYTFDASKLGPIEIPGLGQMAFDQWGELCIDRRFITDEEMKTVRRVEAFLRRYFPAQDKAIKARAPRRRAGGAGLPVFRGFEDARYQQYDALIARMVADFNAHKAEWCGGTKEQASKIADLTGAQVKSHMIEESGGNGARSLAAWAVDPLQVNVPGDWGREKELVGLVKPSKRNEGTAEQNVRAAIKYLSRKGFSTSARPASERPSGFFDGWPKALQRYNGRRDRTDTDRYYSDEYADKIIRRASHPEIFVPIEIKLAAKDAGK